MNDGSAQQNAGQADKGDAEELQDSAALQDAAPSADNAENTALQNIAPSAENTNTVPTDPPTRSDDWLHRSLDHVEQSWRPGTVPTMAVEPSASVGTTPAVGATPVVGTTPAAGVTPAAAVEPSADTAPTAGAAPAVAAEPSAETASTDSAKTEAVAQPTVQPAGDTMESAAEGTTAAVSASSANTETLSTDSNTSTIPGAGGTFAAPNNAQAPTSVYQTSAVTPPATPSGASPAVSANVPSYQNPPASPNGVKNNSGIARLLTARVPAFVVAIAVLAALVLCVGGGFVGYGIASGKSATLSQQLADARSQAAKYKEENAKAGDKNGSLASSNDKLTKENKELTAKNDELAKENEQLKSAATPAQTSSGTMIQIESYSEERSSSQSHELHMTVRNNTPVTFDQASITYILRDASGNQVGGNHYAVGVGTLSPGGTMDVYELYVDDVAPGLTAVPTQWSASDTKQKTYINGTYGSDVATYTLQK